MASTITVLRLASDSWWFLACMGCHKKAYTTANEFVCSDPKCTCVAAAPRYTLDTPAYANFASSNTN
jgi:hypothetical protein